MKKALLSAFFCLISINFFARKDANDLNFNGIKFIA